MLSGWKIWKFKRVFSFLSHLPFSCISTFLLPLLPLFLSIFVEYDAEEWSDEKYVNLSYAVCTT
jgi:hypothetical protein